MTSWERREIVREAIEARQTLIAVGRCLLTCGLAVIEINIKIGRPRKAYRGGGYLIKAADFYRRAGLGRKAEAIGRLLERCRRAWLRYEESEGFR
jgi:hypothetical protein